MLYDDHLKKHLKSIMPPGTAKVCLYGDLENNEQTRYPEQGFYDLWSSVNFDVPNGLYSVGFYDEHGRPLNTAGPKHIRVQMAPRARPEPERAPAPHTALHKPNFIPEHLPELSAVELDLRRAGAEFQKHKMAVAMQKDAIALARSSRHAQELAEQAALNRTYRQELESMAQTQGNLTSRNVEQSAKLMDAAGATSAMLNTVIVNLQKCAESIGRPPPPPVDYSETILKGLGMAGAFALQIVSSARGEPLPSTAQTDPKDGSVEAGFTDKVPGDKATKPSPRARPADEPSRSHRDSAADAKESPAPSQNSDANPAPSIAQPKEGASPPTPRVATDQKKIIQTASDPNGTDGGLDYYLDPKNQQALDDLLTSLDRFKTSTDLEQLIALRMPHLLRRQR